MFAAVTGNTALFLTAIGLLGLLVGSFLNVVILRLPARLQFEWQGQCRELLELEPAAGPAPAGIVWDRSRCRSCGHAIRAYENIPLLSYLLLRGRCSACGERISVRYPLVEAATGALFLVTAWHFGPTPQCAAALVLTGALIALAGIDIDHQLLPDNITLPLLWLGLLSSLWGVFGTPAASIVGAAAGYLSLWSIYHLFRLLTGKEGMGYGDFKLLGGLGAWLGWQSLPVIILLSSLVGAVTGVALLVARRHQRGQPMPFGPFIAAAGWITLIWGDQIIRFYFGLSGLS